MSNLEAVRVPIELEPLFRKAEQYVRAYFAERHADPSTGTVEFHGERYIHVRAASISIEFFDLVRRVYQGQRDADEVARSLLFDVAHAIGLADARDFQREMGVDEPLEALSTGPVHFAYTGWALVDLSDECRPVPDDDYLLVYTHPNSFEADAWIREGREADCPVCVMNAGYSSGWCEASFGMSLVAREIQCRAQGHTSCRFIMAPPDRLDAQIEAWSARHPDEQLTEVKPVPRFFEQLKRRDEELVHAQRMEAIGLLAGGIAHDFNNLLTVILGCAEALELTLPGGSSAHDNATAIVGAAERAGSLTRQLLALSQEQVLDLRTFDLSRLVRELEPLLSGLFSERVVLDLGPLPSAVVEAEPRSVEQVLVNLAVNALEALPEGGTVSISVLPDGDRWCLRFQDDGPGMPESVASRAFDPFFSTKEGNSGLGLATARGIVEQFGGVLELETRPGAGTCFDLYLPRSGGLPDEPEQRGVAPAGGQVLLVIEDDDSIREMLGRFLPASGYVVHTARLAAEAREVAAGLEHLDVVLSDIVMPDENGPAAVASVRALHPDAAVLFMTGYAERQLERLPEGAHVIQKPFTLETVHARLAGILEGT